MRMSRKELLAYIRQLEDENKRLANGWAFTLSDYAALIAKTHSRKPKP